MPNKFEKLRSQMSPGSQASAAKERLISVLAEDQADSYFSDSDGRSELSQRFRKGFVGFESMSISDLIASARDSGVADDLEQDIALLKAGIRVPTRPA